MPFFRFCIFIVILAGSACCFAQNAIEDNLFLQAREAAGKGDRSAIDQLSVLLANHELASYVQFWLIQPRIGEIPVEEIQTTLTKWSGTYLGNRLRGEWLRWLGIRHAWPEFDQEYALMVAPDQELKCLALQSQLSKTTDAAARNKALDEITVLWKTVPVVPDTCVPAFAIAVEAKRLHVDDVWQRIRLQVESNRITDARATLNYLPNDQMPNDKAINQAFNKAPAYLSSGKSSNWKSNSRSYRELAALAIQRVARSNPQQAASDLARISSKLQSNERSWAWGQIAWQGALRQLPETMTWYQRSNNSQLSDEVLEWKVRAALRAGKWPEVMKTIKAMPPALSEKPEWIYWLGRSYDAAGNSLLAKASYLRIAGQYHFYGNLANDELGIPITIPPKPTPPTEDEIGQVAANPSLRRSLALLKLGLRLEGIREWNWGIREFDDRKLLAAAVFAERNMIYDRAINAAEKTRSEHDFTLRYLAPFQDRVSKASREQGLSDAWIFGLIRQESRFVTDAKSSASASGLMQLMPKTARWVAKKIGIENYNAAQINDPDLNLTLGTNYLRMVYESLDFHPILASAAYNAGPGRARKWRADIPLEGAIYAETIPFDETRDYVKKVMSNTVYYSAIFEGKPQSLKSRLGTITPQDWSQTAKLENLP